MDGLPSQLPNDPDALIALLKKQQRTIEKQQKSLQRTEARAERSDARVERFRKKLASKEGHIQQLEERLRELLTKRFGKSSERFNADQYSLFNEAEEQAAEDASGQDTENEEVNVGALKRNVKKKSHALPAHLPRVEVEHELDDDEKQCHCGKTLERIGEQVHEQLSIIPQQHYVIRHIRPKVRLFLQRMHHHRKNAGSTATRLPGIATDAGTRDGIEVYRWHTAVSSGEDRRTFRAIATARQKCTLDH